MPAKDSVTLSDVAAVAGVSLSTASKALSGSDRVSPVTRSRVIEIAERLKFQPNALAQSFARGRSRTIGVLAHRAFNTFARPVLIGATLRLGSQEHAALVYDADNLSRVALTAAINRLRARRIDGILVVGDGLQTVTPSLTAEFAVPVVYAFTLSDDPEDAVFVPDNRAAGRMATERLIASGCRRIAHITAEYGDLAAAMRAQGMTDALDAAGLELVGEIQYGHWSQAWGEQSTHRILSEHWDVDGVFGGNDHIAIGVRSVLERAGVSVPGDIAVVGVDNWEGVIVDQGSRDLTTIDLGLHGIGAAAVDHLLLDHDGTGGVRLHPPTLVSGGTTV